MRPLHALFALSALITSTLASGCSICDRHSETVTVLSSRAFVPAAGSNPAVSLGANLIGLDGDGRATFATLASWGDMNVVVDFGSPPGSSMGLAMHEIAEAVVQTQLDLREVKPGELLAGRSFSLPCTGNSEGCTGYDALQHATASATARVVPPASTPAALLTLQLDGQVMTASGMTFAFSGTLPFDLTDQDYYTGSSGDCS